MSVQLILYPQHYQGYSFTSTPVFTQYVVDNVNFISVNSDTSFSCGAVSASNISPHPDQSAIYHDPPTGTWKRFHSASGNSVYSATTQPTCHFNTSNFTFRLRLPSASSSTWSFCGVYQKIYNLTVGLNYEVEVTVANGTSGSNAGFLCIGIDPNSTTDVNGNNQYSLGTTGRHYFSATTGVYTRTFTANHTEEFLGLAHYGGSGQNMDITKVTLKETPGSAPLNYSDFVDGQVICDLYEDETIPLSLSVDDFKNVTEKIQSHSKDFNLPATKRNNKIFSHIFDVTTSDSDVSFNPYKKTKCVLKENSYVIFDGYLRLIDIRNKKGELSYNVNLFSDTVALADGLKDKTFNDLDLDELGHTYKISNIEKSWSGILDLDNALGSDSFAGSSGATTTDVLKYPFVNWVGSFQQVSGVVQLEELGDAFRPFIKCKYLLDRIIDEAGFSYTSTFLSSTKFNKLYMDFNWGGSNTPQSGNVGGIEFFISYKSNTSITTSFTNLQFWIFGLGSGSAIFNYVYPSYYDTSTHQFNSPGNNILWDSWGGTAWFKNTSGSTQTFEIRCVHNTSVVFTSGTVSIPAGVTQNYSFPNFQIITASGDTVKFQVKASSTAVEHSSNPAGAWIANILYISVTNSHFVSQNLMSNIRGELEQYSFFKAIINMFNLVVIADKSDPKNVIIEPYNDIFLDNANSVQHNWTEKIDNSTMILKPLADLKKYNEFKYEFDEEDAHLKLFRKTTSLEYGESKPNLGADFDILEGENEIELTDFGATFIEPLTAGYDDDFIVPHIVARNDDGTYESFENKARILYDNGIVTMTTGSYYVPALGDDGAETNTNFLQFTHLSDIPVTNTTDDYNFGVHQLSNPLSPTVNNLYNLYWSRYFDELYNVNTRIIELKIKLTPSDIASFEFYDTVIIKNREYRVNKIDYKSGQLSKVELILIP